MKGKLFHKSQPHAFSHTTPGMDDIGTKERISDAGDTLTESPGVPVPTPDMDDFGTKEVALEAKPTETESPGIQGRDFAQADAATLNITHDAHPPTIHDDSGLDEPEDKFNRERDRLGLPHLKRKETVLAQKESHPWQHLGITLGLPMILLFDIIVPCIIYYTWYDKHRGRWKRACEAEGYSIHNCPTEKPEFDKDILGSAIASFGVGELWILFARIYRLFMHRDECAPLLSRNRWELDATSWVYGVAMLIALVPFVVGSTLVIPKLYLYGPSFIMAFLGVLMVVTTLHPFDIPIGINSQPRGSTLRPFIYYAAEDFIAVDGLQDREFRIRYNDRYETNPMFRKFFFNLTLWWTLGVCVYIGCVSAVIWTLEFHYAFGLSLGVLFSYIVVWAGVTFLWTKYEMKREHEAYLKRAGTV
ncbi:hypothetical protein SLS53_007230 [Cytospora paraplurivora]|uniref:Uncharacterized protein n=1 Tax=Cytospora paraplurivora TaxID=2898453 RepID=A0AAN9YCR4_9PEZI